MSRTKQQQQNIFFLEFSYLDIVLHSGKMTKETIKKQQQQQEKKHIQSTGTKISCNGLFGLPHNTQMQKRTILKASSGRIQCRQHGFHNFSSEVNLESSVFVHVLTAAIIGACLTPTVKGKNKQTKKHLLAHVTSCIPHM